MDRQLHPHKNGLRRCPLHDVRISVVTSGSAMNVVQQRSPLQYINASYNIH